MLLKSGFFSQKIFFPFNFVPFCFCFTQNGSMTPVYVIAEIIKHIKQHKTFFKGKVHKDEVRICHVSFCNNFNHITTGSL